MLTNGKRTDWGTWDINYQNKSEQEALEAFNKIEKAIMDEVKIFDFTYLR